MARDSVDYVVGRDAMITEAQWCKLVSRVSRATGGGSMMTYHRDDGYISVTLGGLPLTVEDLPDFETRFIAAIKAFRGEKP